MKLNCDLGESFGNWQMGADAAVMPYIDQANIACGFHAGDPVVTATTLALAKSHSVEVGAHPSYPDLVGFGRRSMRMSENELYQSLHYQIAALAGMAAVQGIRLSYVKPHGALYNDMMRHDDIRHTIMRAVRDYPMPLSLMLQATKDFGQHQQQAAEYELPLLFEAFADRAYGDDGLLISRNEPGAVLSADDMLMQVERLITDGSILSVHGEVLSMPVDSLCVHGDNAEGVKQIQNIRERLNRDAH